MQMKSTTLIYSYVGDDNGGEGVGEEEVRNGKLKEHLHSTHDYMCQGDCGFGHYSYFILVYPF